MDIPPPPYFPNSTVDSSNNNNNNNNVPPPSEPQPETSPNESSSTPSAPPEEVSVKMQLSDSPNGTILAVTQTTGSDELTIVAQVPNGFIKTNGSVKVRGDDEEGKERQLVLNLIHIYLIVSCYSGIMSVPNVRGTSLSLLETHATGNRFQFGKAMTDAERQQFGKMLCASIMRAKNSGIFAFVKHLVLVFADRSQNISHMFVLGRALLHDLVMKGVKIDFLVQTFGEQTFETWNLFSTDPPRVLTKNDYLFTKEDFFPIIASSFIQGDNRKDLIVYFSCIHQMDMTIAASIRAALDNNNASIIAVEMRDEIYLKMTVDDTNFRQLCDALYGLFETKMNKLKAEKTVKHDVKYTFCFSMPAQLVAYMGYLLRANTWGNFQTLAFLGVGKGYAVEVTSDML